MQSRQSNHKLLYFGSIITFLLRSYFNVGKMTTNTSQKSSSENEVWNQVSSKQQTNNTVPSTNQPSGSPNNVQSTTVPASTKQQLEQLHTLREAIFSQDGWGVVSWFHIFSVYFV